MDLTFSTIAAALSQPSYRIQPQGEHIMSDYFCEFEFTSDPADQYWFPLQITTLSRQAAVRIKLAVESSLNENYRVTRSSGPIEIDQWISSDLMREYVERRMQGRIKRLNARLWQFHDVPGVPGLNFWQHLDLVTGIPANIYEHTVATVITQHQFPVRQLTNSLLDFDEFLLINIVNPAAA